MTGILCGAGCVLAACLAVLLCMSVVNSLELTAKTRTLDVLGFAWLCCAFVAMSAFNAFDRLWESALRFVRGLHAALKDRHCRNLGLGRDS